MKKRIVAIFLVLILCVSVLSFVGCDRRSTLQLLDVWQIDDGSLVLEIKDLENIAENKTIQVSFDNGKTWEDTKLERHYNYIKDEYSHYCVAFVSKKLYGKRCKIAVRIVDDAAFITGDKKNRAPKKSNTVEYDIKQPSDFEVENVLVGYIEKDEDYIDEYVFVNEQDRIVLKKFYKTESGKSELLDVKEQDMLDFEYRAFRIEDVPNEIYEITRDFLHSSTWFDEDDLEVLAYSRYVFDSLSNYYQKDNGYKDYDYQNGISKEEYGEGATITIEDDDITEIFIILAVRLKENDTTLCSQYSMINVELV